LALILNIDTSTNNCSVALSNDDKVIGFAESDSGNHTQVLLPLIKKIINDSGYSTNDLSAVAVNVGPGSYTGLRVGIATAKGLCYSLNLPLIPVNGPTALVNAAIKKNNSAIGTYIVLIDNNRNGWYYGVFDESLKIMIPMGGTNSINDLLNKIPTKTIYVCSNMNELKYDTLSYTHVKCIQGITLNAKLLPPISLINMTVINPSILVSAQPFYINSIF